MRVRTRSFDDLIEGLAKFPWRACVRKDQENIVHRLKVQLESIAEMRMTLERSSRDFQRMPSQLLARVFHDAGL